MVHIPAVYGKYGKWKRKELLWNFELDNQKGGRMFFLRDGCTYGELLEMAQEDYMLETEFVEISYGLPQQMLQQVSPDSPPIYVTNDRHVLSLIELGRIDGVRLCISSRKEENEHANVGGHADQCYDDASDDSEKDWVESLSDDESRKDDSLSDDDENEKNGKSKYEVDDRDVDYSEYGKVKNEDEDDNEHESDMSVVVESLKSRFGGNIAPSTTPWSDNIFVTQSFPSMQKLVTELRLTAVMLRFSFKVYNSTKTLFVALCSVNGCKWKLRAAVKNEASTFWVTKYEKLHTCSVSDRSLCSKRCTPKYVGALFIERVGIIDGIEPKHIRDSMKVMCGLNLDYTSSYRALIHAQQLVRGTAETGYEELPSYLRQLKRGNPGSVVHLETDDLDRFQYLFISLKASITGFQYLRRVIVVDGTHLNGRYGGVLLVAAGQDANFQIFPLAYAVVDAENDDSWNWFFSKLKTCFTDEYPMAIISDRHESIKNACESVIPWATRGICYYHLQQNILTKLQGKPFMHLVKGAAYAHTVEDYDRYMNILREINPALAIYLEGADPKLWSRVHFPGDRYNIKTSNIAESINAAVKKAKGFPIPFLLEFIREKFGSWFSKRREDALSLTTKYSRGVEYLLAIREHYAGTMTVERIDGWKFFAKGGPRDAIVDLEQLKCSCGVFQIEKIPCSHVIAACVAARVDWSIYVSPLYTKESLYATWSQNVYPRLSDDEFEVKKEPCGIPNVKVAPGRKKKSRWQTWLEMAMARKKGTKPRKLHKKYRCSKCKQEGHTRPHCGVKDGE
ncbi:unnamed protein product [Microthlaspi erraticum]|uniref:SWIM-type domain-containing protein n=1 Tax=Microthlaspi erraticum TaxID=1685480 RepID=A0A6D2JZ68_9BRAS|nr:unnamed protein product [Microthlaspi erraticum]